MYLMGPRGREHVPVVPLAVAPDNHRHRKEGNMKRAGFVSCACALLLVALVFPLWASSGRQAVITGVIIHISGDTVEVKRGKSELVLHVSDATVVTDPCGAALNRSSLELCQRVRATYRRVDGRNELVRVSIICAGECCRR